MKTIKCLTWTDPQLGPHFTQIIACQSFVQNIKKKYIHSWSSKIQTLDQCEARHARPVCLRSNEMFALSVHDGANVNQLQCRSGSLFLAFALISVERRTLDYHSVHLLNPQLICTWILKNQVGKIKLEKSSWKTQVVQTGVLACKNQFRNTATLHIKE